MNFEGTTGQPVLWCVAQDWPLTSEEEQLTEEELQQLRQGWLAQHDQRTSGIMGLFPCVGNMPVRFTDTIDRGLNIFKNTAGVLKKGGTARRGGSQSGCLH